MDLPQIANKLGLSGSKLVIRKAAELRRLSDLQFDCSVIGVLSSYKKRKQMEKGDYEKWKSSVPASNEQNKKKACKRTTQTSLHLFKEAPETKKLENI